MKAEHAKPKNVEEYIKGFPRPTQAMLQRVRSAIRKALPAAEEAISYDMPTYKLDGRAVMHFAGWKQHYSLYGSTRQLDATFKDDLASYEVNGKGTIRFPLSEPGPERLIARLAKFRAKEAAEHQKTKAARR